MRLPRQLIESPFFSFESKRELIASLNGLVSEYELAQIEKLSNLSLPPITSKEVLGAMLGISPGIIWSFQFRTKRHYRVFPIKKGKKIRIIYAPKIGIKIIQKWLSFHLQNIAKCPDHVYGFIPGKSHIQAASVHCGSKWVYSVDILNFFGSTPQNLLSSYLLNLGYDFGSAKLISDLCCYEGFIAQGAPSSPAISNALFQQIDLDLIELANRYNVNLTRYADDIVFLAKMFFQSQ